MTAHFEGVSRRVLLGNLLALALIGCGSGPVQTEQVPEDPPFDSYVIGVPDVLQITVWEQPDLSGEVLVRRDGKISVPLLGDEVAAGRTPGGIDALTVMMNDVGPETYGDLPPQIKTDTLLVWSHNNSNNPVSDAKRLNREIKGSRLIIVKDSGHYIQEENPQALAEAVKGFLQ